jgi:hypothetical protein
MGILYSNLIYLQEEIDDYLIWEQNENYGQYLQKWGYLVLAKKMVKET